MKNITATSNAQVPAMLNYQGRVSIGGSNYSGNGGFKFALVNSDGTKTFWNNSGATNETEPSANVSLVVTQGIYSVLVGDTSIANMAAIPETVFTNTDLRLRVWFSSETNGTFAAFSPDQRLGSVPYAIRAGALQNAGATGVSSFVGGGVNNTASATNATVVGGSANTNAGFASFIGGGTGNTVRSNYQFGAVKHAVICGGYSNVVGHLSTVPGGGRCKATNTGAFVWSGRDDVETVSDADYSFTVRAPGGVRFITSIATNNLIIGPGGFNGAGLLPGGTAWTAVSDSNAKTAVTPVDPRAILSKLEKLPVTEWEYKHDPHRRYFGPMAQDFHVAFGLGNDDKTINTLDADGVLFLSVKGLAEELKERDKTIEDLKAQNEELSRKIEAIDERLNSLPPAK